MRHMDFLNVQPNHMHTLLRQFVYSLFHSVDCFSAIKARKEQQQTTTAHELNDRAITLPTRNLSITMFAFLQKVVSDTMHSMQIFTIDLVNSTPLLDV